MVALSVKVVLGLVLALQVAEHYCASITQDEYYDRVWKLVCTKFNDPPTISLDECMTEMRKCRTPADANGKSQYVPSAFISWIKKYCTHPRCFACKDIIKLPGFESATENPGTTGNMMAGCLQTGAQELYSRNCFNQGNTEWRSYLNCSRQATRY